MKHTPGPWKAEDDVYAIHPNDMVGCTISTRINGTYFPIAELRISKYPKPYEMREVVRANAHLIATAPELLEEHKQWAKILGHIFVRALQGDYEALQIYAREMKIKYRNGEPILKSEAIAKAEAEGKEDDFDPNEGREC